MNKRILPLIMMALLFPLMTWAQGIMVTGKVISGDDGMGLPGVYAVQVLGGKMVTRKIVKN